MRIVIQSHNAGAKLLGLCVLCLLSQYFFLVHSMMINRENEHPEFNFSLNQPAKCKLSPDPHRVKGALYYLVECSPDVSDVVITFSGTKPVYSLDGSELPSITTYPSRGGTVTHFVKQCNTTTATDTCPSIQLDVSRSEGNIPLLSRRGLIFSNYAQAPPKFNPKKLTYDIKLYSREPTTIVARAAPGFLVDFVPSYTEKGFVEQSAIMTFTPQGNEGETESFQVIVTNADRSIFTTYTINVNVIRSVTAKLDSVNVYPGRLDPEFQPTKYSYFYRVPDGTSSVVLELKAVNDRDARCFVEPLGLETEQKPTITSKSSAVFQQAYYAMKHWNGRLKNDTTFATPDPSKVLHEPISVGASGSVTMELPKHPHSTAIVVDCVASDDTYKTRYVFNVVKQIGGSTLLTKLEVPFIPFDRPFDPHSSGPYYANAALHAVDGDQAKWVNFHVVPNNRRAICKVEGKEVDATTHLSRYFRVLSGEKRQFRISVRTAENAVEEQYVVVVDRPAPWYKSARIAGKIGDWVGLASSTVAATRAVNFLNNAKFLHFISLTNRLSGNPETYDAYSQQLNRWNLQWDIPEHVYMVDQHTNKSFYVPPFSYRTLQEFEVTPNSKLGILPATVSHLSGVSSVDLDALVKQAVSRLKMYEAPVQAIKSDVDVNPDWKIVHTDPALMKMAASNVLSNLVEQKFKEANKSGASAASRLQSPHRLLLEDAASRYDIVMRMDAEYKNQQKLLNYSSSVVIITIGLLGIAVIYAAIWMLYLRDVREGWTTLRQDFPAILKPSHFWTFLLDYAIISYVQSCCGIIFTTGNRNIAIRLFGFTTTANEIAWFAATMLVLFPVCFLAISCVILVKARKNLLYSKTFQRYHDSRCEELKACQRFFRWVPLLSKFFTVEITSVAPVTRYPTLTKDTSDGPIHFEEESRINAPSLIGNPNNIHCTNDPMDLEVTGMNTSTGYQTLLGISGTKVNYREKQDAIKVTLTQDAFEPRLDTINPALYNRFPQALVGYSKYKVKNSYDHVINVQVEVQLRHLTSLMSLQSYVFWVPCENLRLDIVDNWNLLFGKSPKGNLFYWIFDRCITTAIIIFLNAYADRRGIAHVLVFAFVCLLTAALNFPSTLSSSTSKWFRLMDIEVDSNRQYRHMKELEETKFRIWPFYHACVREQFKTIRNRKRNYEMWSMSNFVRQYIAKPFNKLQNLEFWKTRCWLTVRECIIGPVASDAIKFLTLFTIFMGNFSIGIYTDVFSSFLGMLLTITSLLCMNTEGLQDWWNQSKLTFREIGILCRRCIIMAVDYFSEPRLMGRKFTHFMSSCQRTLQGEKGVSFGYLGYSGETVRDFKVSEVVIISNEVGVHLPGKIEHSGKTKNQMKYSDSMERFRFGLHKTLYINGSLGAYRPTLDRALPIQMPFRQFFHLGKGKDVGNLMNRLAATIQIVNYNESRGASGYRHSAEDDSFLSLYTDPHLMTEYGKLRMKQQGHCYVVRWLPDRECIYIRGPAIKSDTEYSITSLASKPQLEDELPTVRSSASTVELGGDFVGTGIAEAHCKSSGILLVPIKIDEAPDLYRPIQLSRTGGESFEIDPLRIKVCYYEYDVGRSRRREMVLRSRKLIASSIPYNVSWTIKTKGKKINATAKSPADGVLFVPWIDNQLPDLHSHISIRDESENSKTSGAVIDIDPRDTDAHQFSLPPIRYNGMTRRVVSAASGFTQFISSIIGRNPVKDVLDEPIPCTVVQCTNPLECQYRLEPNFEEAMKMVTARIEQLTGMKRDLEVPERLGYIWSEFMSTNEFINFWDSLGVNIVIRGVWLNPITNTNHVYIKQNQQRISEGQLKFRAEIARRVEARIGLLSTLYDRYKIWNKAYLDTDLYSYQLVRDAQEWGVTETSQFDMQIQQLQRIKSQYESALSDFQYPVTVDDRSICRREKFDAQLRIWREELTAWLFQCEGASLFAEQGGKSCAQATIDDCMRALEHSIRRRENAHSSTCRTVLHYVINSVAVRGRDTNWKPDPLASHYCMVRLFPGDKEDDSRINWNHERWTPCYLKLAGDKIVLLFPHPVDAKADVPEFYEDDITKRWSWNQLQAYYIPLQCFEKLFLSIDPSIANDPRASDDVRRMHAKLVLKKNTEIHIDDRYVKNLFTSEFWDELLYGEEGNVLKIRLGHTVSNKDQNLYNNDDSFLHSDRVTVLPLTFRFHHSYFDKWQSAIRLAQMNNPHKEIDDFNGHVDGDGYSVSDVSFSDDPYEIVRSLPPVSSESEVEPIQSHEPESFVSDLDIESFDASLAASSEPSEKVVGSDINISHYKGNFRDYRFSGSSGRLYDNNGRIVYDGDWVEGQRWGKGRSIFKDHKGIEWEFEGHFIADEMRRGKLSLIDDKELARLRNSKNKADRFTIVSYEGTFALPAFLRGVVTGENKKRDFIRMNSNCGIRGKPNISPIFLKNLFDHGNEIDDKEDKELIIDIRRAVSACAEEGTASAAYAWIQENYGKQEFAKFERKDSAGSIDSNITVDAQNALEEYLPHRSRWTRLLNPNAGYQSLFDRFLDGEMVFADGSRYKGQVLNGFPHGKGILSCPNCALLYHGYWKKGRPNGYGVLAVGEQGDSSRIEYYGYFKDGKRDGRGVQLAKDGKVVIKGEYKNDILNGKSCSIDLADDVLSQFPGTYKRFIGGVKGAVPSGRGRLVWNDGIVYKGDFKEGKRNGDGTMKDKQNKTIVAGNWEKDFPDGRIMTMVLPDGKLYSGDVKNGQRQGMGEVYTHGVAFYEGLWMNDLPNGRGALYAVDGDYEGEFKAGKRHGKGRFIFKTNPMPNGKPRVYEGDWKNDKPDGIGRYVNELGIENTYKFKEGQLLPSSTKVYKTGVCGKVPVMGVKFYVEPSAVTAHDPKYWGMKRRIDVGKIKELHSIGAFAWAKHEEKEFVYAESAVSLLLEDCDELKRPPIKQKSLQSVQSSSDTRTVEVLEVRIIEAIDLHSMDHGKKLDPYCKVIVGRKMKKTKPINGGGSNPKWNSSLNFGRTGADWIYFEVWDKDTITRDDFIGHAEYDLRTFIENGEKHKEAIMPLMRTVRGQDVSSGHIKVEFSILGNRLFTGTAIQSQQLLHSKNVAIPKGQPYMEINVHSVANLHNTELLGKMDLYVKYELGSTKAQTDYKKNGGTTCELNFITTIPYNNEPILRFEVWDHDRTSKEDFVGHGSVDLNSFKSGDIELFRDAKKKASAGKIKLTVNIIKP